MKTDDLDRGRVKIEIFICFSSRFDMTSQIELIPISEGNRVILKVNEKLTVGRGSSLGVSFQ